MNTIGQIRRTAGIGLWGSVGVVVVTAALLLVSPWRFYPNEYTARLLIVAAAVLGVGVVSMTLLTVRRRIPQLRQTDDINEKLAGYSTHIAGIYRATLVAVVLICGLALLANQSALLMLAMVATLVLFLAWPNSERMKVDLGLTDEEFQALDDKN